MIAAVVISIIFGYIFIASASAARHHAKISRDCDYENCWNKMWCGHCYASVYLYGAAWPLAIPIVMGFNFGTLLDFESRTARRRKRELEEAQHKAKVAEAREREHAALDRELQKLTTS